MNSAGNNITEKGLKSISSNSFQGLKSIWISSWILISDFNPISVKGARLLIKSNLKSLEDIYIGNIYLTESSAI